MKLYITTLVLFALQNTNVSADTSSTISDLTSRLESIKDEASTIVEEISQKESELMNEEFASQKENEMMNEISPESNFRGEIMTPHSEVDFGGVSSQFNEILNTLPDEEIRSNIIERIEEGNIDVAEAQFKKFLGKYVADMPQGHAKETVSRSKSELMAFISLQFKHMRDAQVTRKFEEETKEDNVKMTPVQAKRLIVGIPDETVKNDVIYKIEHKDVAGAEIAIDEFFKTYVNSIDDETKKVKLNKGREALLSALHEAVEKWEDIENEVPEYYEDEVREDSYDTNSEVEFEGVSSQFNEILNTLPHNQIRNNIIERIEEGNIDEAEAQFKKFLGKYVADMPQGHEKETVSRSQSELMDYISFQFQTMRDAQDKQKFEPKFEETFEETFKEEAKEDKKEEMREILDEIAENQLLIEEALEKLGGN